MREQVVDSDPVHLHCRLCGQPIYARIRYFDTRKSIRTTEKEMVGIVQLVMLPACQDCFEADPTAENAIARMDAVVKDQTRLYSKS